MSSARLWTDDTGRRRWQPITSSGEARWIDDGLPVWRTDEDRLTTIHRVSLWRFRCVAVWLARRRERALAHANWTLQE